ncbi:MAG: amino acid adenylation domain-containing protein, partial [bacterium]|nr:amino acid adenylation domain-containing protein [bacterium]
QEVPFEELVDKLEPRRDPSRNPIFDISMIVQNVMEPGGGTGTREMEKETPPTASEKRTVAAGNGAKGTGPESRAGKGEGGAAQTPGKTTAKFDISFSIYETPQNIHVEIEYYTGIFKAATIRRMADHFNNIIKAVVGNPAVKPDQIDVMTQQEKQQILYEFNDTAAEYPGHKTIHRLFEEQVERTPHAAALVGAIHEAPPEDNRQRQQGMGNPALITLTYDSINREANRLARYLQGKNGIKPGDRVGVYMPQTLSRVPALLGILKAGAVYIPLDRELPVERITYMIKDAGISSLLAEKNIPEQLEKLQTGSPALQHIIRLETNEINPEEEGNPNLNIQSTAPAYIIYTSGTTGRPKGVILEHRGMANLNTKYTREFKIGSRDRIIQFANISFDASLSEIFMTILNGAVLHLLDRETIGDYARFQAYLERQHITVATLPPPYAANLDARRLRLRMLITAGTSPNPGFMKKCSHLEYINAFGPTENTICCSYWSSAWEEETDRITIGKPIKNVQLYILNNKMAPQPLGVPGQLCIAGAGLARGYLNNPELTAQRFVKTTTIPNNQYPITNNVFYLTGDRARWLPGGNIEFLGRIDHQVKIRGYRIELGEIENRILTHPQIKETVVIARETENKEKYLCAYIVMATPATGETDIAGTLKNHIAGFLPQYMIPAFIITLDSIPLTISGKIDTKALPQPGLKPVEKNEKPRDATEKQLAEIWASVLGIEKERIGVESDFFDLGGHSLKATILVARIHEKMNSKVPLQQIFKTPALGALAAYIKTSGEERYATIQPVEKREHYALSPAQKRLFILQRMDEESVSYNMPQRYPLSPEIDKERLETIFKKLIHRHESLRTSFHMIDDTPAQKICAPGKEEFSIRQYKTVAEMKTRQSGISTPFDLTRSPLLRVAMVEPKSGEKTLYLDMHHIISDGISQALLIEEFKTLAEGGHLPTLRLQYKDYAQWQNSETRQHRIRAQEKFWLERFHGELPLLELPLDNSRPLIRRSEGKIA